MKGPRGRAITSGADDRSVPWLKSSGCWGSSCGRSFGGLGGAQTRAVMAAANFSGDTKHHPPETAGGSILVTLIESVGFPHSRDGAARAPAAGPPADDGR